MRCPRCTAENVVNAASCVACGTAISAGACTRCGANNPIASRFCGQCAWPIGPPPSPPAQTVADAERRQITVLFCDLVGSTSLSQELDLEDFRDVLQAYQSACTTIVNRFDGHVAQFLGDGVLVYFGFPSAHEDDARRAVRAATEILKAVSGLTANAGALRARVGIHTGLVVVGGVGSGDQQQQLALGEPPNIASRVQGKAKPSTVVISDSTYRLVEGYFEVEDLGDHHLEGMARPARLYCVVRESGAASRLDAARAGGLTPFVGRAGELDLLLDSWDYVRRGHGRVITIRGEAGIGKSRLLEVLRDRVSDQTEALECRCSPYHQNSVLYPVITMLDRHFGLSVEGSNEQKLARLRAALTEAGVSSTHAVALLASLFSIPVEEGQGPPTDMPPQKQRQLTLDAVADWLIGTGLKKSILFILEDLHWADPTTLEFARLIINREPSSHLLICLTARPEFRTNWGTAKVLIELNLRPLPDADVTTMINLVAGKTLPEGVLTQLRARTEGIPLFVEETTRAIIESGALRLLDDHYELTGPLLPGSIPASVQDSLTARLDRLGPSKALAQLAATLGREFRYDILKAVSGKEDDSLQLDLARLVESDLLLAEGVPPRAVYSFKHALIRDAAYESLLRRTRQQYHQTIARVLTNQFGHIADLEPELVASHFETAALPGDAVAWWSKAGQRALERAANREAIAHLQRALALLELLPDATERLRLELDLQLALGPAQMAIRGWAAKEVEVACNRARALCEQLGAGDRLLHALWGLWTMHFLRGEMDQALAIGERVLAMAMGADIPMLKVMGHHAAGFTLFFRGDFAAARQHAEEGIALFDLDQERAIVSTVQFSSTVALRSFLGASLWMLGAHGQADVEMEKALALAETLKHPPSLAFGLSFRVYLHFYRREYEATRQVAERLLALSQAEGFLLWIPVAIMYRGWARAGQGDADNGVAEIKRGMEVFLATGTSLTRVQVLAAQAEMIWKAGDREEALRVADEGIAEAAARREHLYEPELHRLKAEMLLDQSGVADATAAEKELREALAVARKQGARSLELRATASLCRLLRAQGQDSEARTLQDALTNWFEKNMEASDLRNASRSIEELRA